MEPYWRPLVHAYRIPETQECHFVVTETSPLQHFLGETVWGDRWVKVFIWQENEDYQDRLWPEHEEERIRGANLAEGRAIKELEDSKLHSAIRIKDGDYNFLIDNHNFYSFDTESGKTTVFKIL